MEKSEATIRAKISAQTRARLLFQREIGIDWASEKSILTPKVLEGLLAQCQKMEKLRDDNFRGVCLMVFAMFFVANGATFEVPVLKVALSEIPALHSLLGFTAAILMLMYSMAAISVGAYAGLIGEFHSRYSERTRIDPDILSAAHAPNWFVLKIFESDFNNYQFGAHIQPVGFTKLVNFVARGIIRLFFWSAAIGVYAYISYFILFEIPHGWFNLGVKIVSGIALVGAVLLVLIADFHFEYEESKPQQTTVEGDASVK